MCQNLHTTLQYQCRHRVEELPTFVPCKEADERGSDCETIKENYNFGISSKPGKCPDCVAKEEEEGK